MCLVPGTGAAMDVFERFLQMLPALDSDFLMCPAAVG
jgi:hypothetical protein